MLDVLRDAIRQLEAPSEEIDPGAAWIDSQTVKTSERSAERGYDGGKKITGRKRNIAVDTLGLLLAVTVAVASLDDAAAAPGVFAQLKPGNHPRLQVVWADSKYHNHNLNAWPKRQRSITWELQVVRRSTDAIGFVLLPKRWVVERTFSWIGRWRRMSRDYEHRTDSSEAMIKVALIGPMLRRLAPSSSQAEFKYDVTAQLASRIGSYAFDAINWLQIRLTDENLDASDVSAATEYCGTRCVKYSGPFLFASCIAGTRRRR